ncbi:MAG: FkbM family methyltransferase [Caldilinea sp. CFX5]|nr:FkbM family methyltransferase [Caldilinea sp. CFX5]
MMTTLRSYYRQWEQQPLIGPLLRTPGNLARRTLVAWFAYAKKRRWQARIKLVQQCADNQFIPRIANAGQVVDGYQIMHNGLKIHIGSYYGAAVTEMLQVNRGVHEPQEERIFQEVLRVLPAQATMIELGAYWGFYSMWFHQVISEPTCYLIEASPAYLTLGQQNFALNGMKADFTNYWIGARSASTPPPGVGKSATPTIALDDFLAQKGIAHVHLLHADIQGAELDLLAGAANALNSQRIDYIFISTHGADLHRDCIARLTGLGYTIIAEASPAESYAEDGVIAARRAGIDAPAAIAIDKRKPAS